MTEEHKPTAVHGAGPQIQAQLTIQFFVGGGVQIHCTDPDMVRTLGYLELAKATVIGGAGEPEEKPRVQPVRVI